MFYKPLKFLFTLCTVITFISCGNSNEESIVTDVVPAYVISTEKMENVLVDLHAVDAAINLGYINQAALIYNKSKIQDSIFFEHKISRADYDSSVSWYSKHLEDFMLIYENVTVKLNQKHGEAQN